MDSGNKISPFGILIIIILLVAIFLLCWHLIAIPELTSATPIVINKVEDPKILGDNLIKLDNSKLGNSGFLKAELRDPCIPINSETTQPNLPLNYRNQKCKDNYECITNIVKGGGICLTKYGKPCNDYFECVPGTYCINGICQKKIRNSNLNKTCNNSSDCGNKGTVCYKNKCKFKIYKPDNDPPSFGCIFDEHCDLYKSAGNEVTCKEADFVEIKENFIYRGDAGNGNHLFEPENTNFYLSSLTLNDDQIMIDNNVYQFLGIENGKIIVSNNDTDFEENVSYVIIRDEVKKNICVVSYPIGSKLINIENSETPYPCVSDGVPGTHEGKTYCKEKIDFGVSGQICNISELNCNSSLECSYNSRLQTNISNNYNTIGTSIGGVELGTIGKCFAQEVSHYGDCDESSRICIKPLICSSGKCVNYYNILEPPEIIGCPPGFVFKKDKCIVSFEDNNINFCIDSTDCDSSGSVKKCIGQQLNVYKNSEFVLSKIEQIDSGKDGIYPKAKILMSKHYLESEPNKPSAIGYYSFEEGYEDENCKINIGPSTYRFNINFDNKEIKQKDIRLSIFKKENETHQLNIEYLQKYPEYRMRKYKTSWGDGAEADKKFIIPYSYGLCQGVSIFLSKTSEKNLFRELSGNLNYFYGTSSNTENKWEIDNFDYQTLKEFDNMYIFDSNYSIFGKETDNEEKLKFKNNFQYSGAEKSNITDFLNLGDTVTYMQNGSPGVSAKILPAGDKISLEDKNPYVTVIGEENVILVKNYNSINTDFYVSGSSISDGGKFEYDITDYEKAPYLKLEEKYGLNIMTYNIDEKTHAGNPIIINIKEKKNYFKTDKTEGPGVNYLHQNSPIGYFTDTKSLKYINTEIDEKNIIITNKLTKTTNHVLNISYSTSTQAGKIFDENKFYSMNYFDSGTCNLIKYSINNVASVPNSKVFSEADNYNPEPNKYILPYEIDRVQYYEQSQGVSETLDFFTSFKEIVPNNPKSFLAMENKLRKTEWGINDKKLELKYLGKNIAHGAKGDSNITDVDNKIYGYCSPIEMEKFYDYLSTPGKIPGLNEFAEGSFDIIINNQDDIDAILKYSGSELVIGFKYTGDDDSIGPTDKILSTWVITGISNYEIDGDKEKLVLKINRKDNLLFPPDSDYKLFTPYLFPNNIFPVSFKIGNKIKDGTAIVSSCSENSTLYRKTSYNKIFQYKGDIICIFNVLNFTIGQTSIDYSLNNPYYYDSDLIDTELTLRDGGYPLFPEDDYIYIVNNLFTSTLNISPQIEFNNYLVSPITFKSNYVTGVNGKGDFSLKIDTIPFYSGEEDRKGDLDESFKSRIIWNYADFFETTEKIEFNKMVFNYNPGNTDNNMNFYFFLTNQEDKMLFFITASKTYSIFNRPIPIMLQSEKYYDKSFMTPFDNNLYIIGKICLIT